MFANKTQPTIKRLKKVVRYVLGVLLFVFISTFALLNIPYIQQRTTVWVANELTELLGAKVTVGRINIGLLNRVIIDDLLLEDQSGKEMLKVSRMSAKYDILPLFRGRISIGSVQLFGFNIQLNKATPEADPNFKFVLDAFASNDSVQPPPTIDLRINSLLIRRGTLAYDVLSAEETPGKFNPKHIKLYNILGNISLKALQNDSINAQIKRFSVDEQSGLELRKLSLKVLGTENNMTIENFEVGLPGTSLRMDTIRMNYDSLGAFNNFLTDVDFSFRMLPSHVTLQDIAPFVPVFESFKERIDLELNASGTIDQLNCSRLLVRADNHLRMMGDVQFQGLASPANAFIYGKLSHLSADEAGMDFIVRNFDKHYTHTPPLLQRLGDISFNGEITGYFTDLVTYGTLKTDLGTVQGDVKLSSNKQKGIFSYSGGIQTEEFELGKWLNDPNWGNVSYKLNVQSNHSPHKYPHVVMKGIIESLEYNDYQYQNITLDGEYKDGGFDGICQLNDDNGMVFLNGQINMSEKIPVFNFHADIQHVRPHDLKLTSNYIDSEFSLKLNANFTGGNIDEMIGSIRVDSVLYSAPNKSLFIDNITVDAAHEDERNTLSLHSEFVQAKIEGQYSYKTIGNNIMHIVSEYLPAIFPKKTEQIAGHNNFIFDINIHNTEILPIVFDVPLSIYSQSTIKGFFNGDDNRFKVEGHFPRLQYGKNFIESGLLLCENSPDNIHGLVRLISHRKNGIISLTLDALGNNDLLTTKVNWGNNAETTYSGHFEALTSFSKTEESPQVQTVIDIKPTHVILNDTVWDIHQSQITIDEKNIHIDKFRFSREDQFLLIDGYASDDMRSSVNVELKDINIGYVFDVFNLRSVDFHGMASGHAFINSALKNPVMNTYLSVKNFRFNNAYLGEMDIYGEWDNDKQGIFLKAKIKETDSSLALISDNEVTGYIFPLKPKSGIDLDIKANNLNAGFLSEYLDNITSNLKGRVSGDVHFYGGFSSLNIEGKAKADATFKIDVLNTSFAINDSIRMSEREISFNNISFSDLEGHRGTANGYLRHHNFRNMNYRFQLNATNMLVMKTEEDPDMPFYGTVYATGSALLTGDGQALNVDAAVTTNRNTNFVYTLAESASAVNSQFIKFVDKTPTKRSFQDSIQLYSEFELAQKRYKQEDDDQEMDLRIDISVDATPDANVRIIMDPGSGDYISGKGTGNIRAEYYNKGDIRMFGNYIIDQGVYKFSLQEVIRKDFLITQGSNIMFNGNPGNAMLDIQAIYTVNSASLTDLIPENSELIKRKNVRVNCLMNLSGVLYRPTIKLGIELPNEREEIQELVRNYVSTDEEINMQILYLLGIGKFYTPDNMYSTQNSNMMTSVISSTLSGQLNNIFSQFMENQNWNFGTNVSTGERGWTDVEIEGILSAQLLNNRLIINGNFGYRENPLSDTNFIGDFDAQWLLNPSGDLRLKAYNQTNDRYFTRTNLTTQGVGILYKKDFNRWRELFFWLKWKAVRKKAESQTSDSP